MKLTTPEQLAAWAAEYYGWGLGSKAEVLDNLKNKTPTSLWRWREDNKDVIYNRPRPYWAHNIDSDNSFWVYVTADDPMKIGYTPTDAYGIADRQIVTTVGRFLRKHYPELSKESICHYVNQHRSTYGPAELAIAFDAADIQHAYENGPSSCMAGKDWSYENPYRIYDGPDTVLALLYRGDRIVARTVCNINTDPMQYTRIYGDANVLKTKLLELGFAEGSLNDVRLRLHIVDDSCAVCPYIDTVDRADIEGDFLFLGDGDFSPQTTNGLLQIYNKEDDEDMFFCEHCEEDCSEEDNHACEAHNGHGGLTICSSCAEGSYTIAIINRRAYEAYVHDAEIIEVRNQYYLNDDDLLCALGFIYCDQEEQWFHPGDICTPKYRDEHCPTDKCTYGESNEWIHDDDAIKTDSGQTHHVDDTVEIEGKVYSLEEAEELNFPLPRIHRITDSIEFADRQGQLEIT